MYLLSDCAIDQNQSDIVGIMEKTATVRIMERRMIKKKDRAVTLIIVLFRLIQCRNVSFTVVKKFMNTKSSANSEDLHRLKIFVLMKLREERSAFLSPS